MKLVPKYNLWWPDFEEDPVAELDRIMKRVPDCDLVMEFVGARGIAVQAGGHVGLYARQLAKYFSLVHSFEPVSEMFDCLTLNTKYNSNIIVHPEALGAKRMTVNIASRAGGRSKVADKGVPVRQIMLEDLQLPRCDLIYLDVEGYELEVLQGALMIIEAYRPVIVLEMLAGSRDTYVPFMQKLGYRHIRQFHADWVFIK